MRYQTIPFLAFLILISGPTTPSWAARIDCTQSALLAAISQANADGGGTITFNCSNTTLPMTVGLGHISNNVIIDGENRDITIDNVASLAGCLEGDGGGDGGGDAIGQFTGSGNVLRNLTFRYFMESWQIKGPNNTVEGNTFLGHFCSDDAISTIAPGATNFVVRNNTIRDYRDKAIQSSYGSGLFEGNTFINTTQPLRGPYDNSAGGLMIIRGNNFTATSASKCDGARYDGNYQIVFENNTHSNCLRGARFAGTTQVLIKNNTFTGNNRAGLQLYGSARASLSGNNFTGNLGGGVWIYESAQADLGGGSMAINGQIVSSPGNNTLKGNGNADVRNENAGFTVKAEQNCWDHATVSEVINQDTTGLVDVDPFRTTCSIPPSLPPPPSIPPLPPPTLTLPSYLPVTGSLTATYPASYSNITYRWSITQETAPSAAGLRTPGRLQGTALPAASSLQPRAQTATFTAGATASLAGYALEPGYYSVSVQAVDSAGKVSAAARGYVTLVEADFSGVRPFPNPWRGDRHAGKNVTFTGLPSGSTVKIFTVSGLHVKTLTPVLATASWDLTNNNGVKVASGIYVYVVKAGENSGSDSAGKATGQIMVIR